MKNYDSSSDAELVRSLRQGSKEAFHLLYRRYFDSLYRFAFSRASSRDFAKDLLHDLFVKIWDSRSRLNPQKSIKSLLYTSLSNMITDHFRSKGAQSLSLKSSIINTAANDADAEIDLNAAINNLPPKLKEVFLMSRFDGFKYSEIAEILGISVKAVEKRMTKAFKILRAALSESET